MKHAPNWSGNDYPLCGLALEAADDPCTGETEQVVIAEIGDRVTCLDCLRVIDHCKRNFAARGLVVPT